jgi:hypothetical protein
VNITPKGNDGVEGIIAERQRLRVGFLEFDRQTIGRCPRTASFQQA